MVLSDDCEPIWSTIDTIVTTMLTYALNILLLYLILYRTSADLRPYRRILITTCVIDIWTCTVLYAFQVKVDLQNNIRIYYFAGNISRWLSGLFEDVEVHYFLSIILFSALVMNGYSMIVPFAYRYLMICRDYIMSNRFYAGLLVFMSIISVIAATLPMYIASLYAREGLQKLPPVDDYCPQLQRLPFYPREFALRSTVNTVLHVIFVCFGASTLLILVTVVTLAYLISRHVNRQIAKSKMLGGSGAAQRAQRSIQFTLSLQALMPLVFAVIPIGSSQVCSKFYEPCLRPAVNLAFHAFAWAPLINALFTMAFIKCYRVFLLRQLTRLPLVGRPIRQNFLSPATSQLFPSSPTQTASSSPAVLTFSGPYLGPAPSEEDIKRRMSLLPARSANALQGRGTFGTPTFSRQSNKIPN